MLFVLVSNHPDFYLDGPILTSNKKKNTFKSMHSFYQKIFYKFHSGEINGQYMIHIVFILIILIQICYACYTCIIIYIHKVIV